MRRASLAIAFGGPALGLAAMGYLTGDFALCVAVMTVGFSLNGFNVPVFLNLVDIAPNFTGSAGGLVQTCGAASGFLVPMLTSRLTSEDPSSPGLWREVFLLACLLYLAALALYCREVSVEPQPFNLQEAAEAADQEEQEARRPMIQAEGGGESSDEERNYA